jgi:hypothetical protein
MNEALLRSLIESLQSKLHAGQAIGVHSSIRWQGADRLAVGQEHWRVFQCDSVLAMRQHLTESASSPLVLCTALPTSAVGDDVRARLVTHQLVPVDPWNALADRFKAREVDPALRQSNVIADAALDALGSIVPDVAASGVLTAEAVWNIILRQRLGLEAAKPDLLDFLPWVTKENSAGKWASLGPELHTALVPWLERSVGDLAPILLRSMTDGNGEDALALGIALGALRSSQADSRTLGRMERFTGHQPLSPHQAQSWNDAAEKWAAARAAEEEGIDKVRRTLERADQLLKSLGAAEAACQSRWSPLGFQQRLSEFAESLGGDDAAKCQSAFALVSAHVASGYLEDLKTRREIAGMAMRLRRWLEKPAGTPLSLEQAALAYEQDGSWVDLARHRLLTGDASEGVSRFYRKLFEKVTARRESENRHFAELLVAMTSSNQVSASLLPVEDVLAKIVAPLAKHVAAGVLLILMDGMSLPIWRELSIDLGRNGWPEWVPKESAAHRSILTALPSATKFSRASLLCGKLIAGTQNEEKRGFEGNVDLLAASRPGAPPALFHKDEVGTIGNDLGESVRLAIRDARRKVVGAVVNVIDDHLEGPQQLAIQWGLKSIPVIQTLLSEARDAGRVVILASDHGHVLDRGARLRRKIDSSDRWRPVHEDAPVEEGELLVQGSRVLVEGGGRMISPISENVRYTANLRLGYHGGLTPQECLAPLAVMASSFMDINGWAADTLSPPEWWFDVIPALGAEPPRKPATSKRKGSGTDAPLLFQTAPSSVDWVDALLASEIFAEQMSTFAGRLKREQVEGALRVLADRNTVLLKSVFAQRVSMSALRVEGLIASLQRILNVEGYAVLSVDASQTIRLNLSLLREQFGLGENSGG